MNALLWSALVLGLFTNLHCLGMCGPIALALPLNRSSIFTKSSGVLVYNFGRVLVYGLLGMLFGVFGKGLNIVGLQQFISVALGLIILLSVVFPAWFKIDVFSNQFVLKPIQQLKKKATAQLNKKGYMALFVFGMFNALLPCGMVYLALAGAITTGIWFDGFLFMVLYGIGTLPVMIGFPLLGAYFPITKKKWYKKSVPALAFVFAVLLVLRGTNLDIPYMSPGISSDGKTMHVKCH